MVVPVEKVQQSNIYQSSGGPCDLSLPWNYKVAIGKFEAVRDLVYAHKNKDNKKIGELLGYPKCCCDFFEDVWVNNNWVDTTIPMANMNGNTIEYEQWIPYCNILLRWLGLRFVSHLPCSFNCARTSSIGIEYKKLAYDKGYRTTADTLYDILSWPVEWSGLHGIGLVTTPVCRVGFRTDMLEDKHTVRLLSEHKPDETQSGLSFPFLKQRHLVVKKPNANGFYDEAGQTRAHNMILDLIRYIEPKPRSVIDLGCGDGTLLKKIFEDFGSETTGVDIDPTKQPDIVADIFDATYLARKGFDLALISKARIQENRAAWLVFLPILEQYCNYLLIYSYNQDKSRVPTGSFNLRSAIGVDPYHMELYKL